MYILIGDSPVDLRCSTPGCRRKKHEKESGGYYDYCSRSCRDNCLPDLSQPL